LRTYTTRAFGARWVKIITGPGREKKAKGTGELVRNKLSTETLITLD